MDSALMPRARIDSTSYSHVVVCPCGFRAVCNSASDARDERDRHDLVAHPEHHRNAIEAMSKRSTRSRLRTPRSVRRSI